MGVLCASVLHSVELKLINFRTTGNSTESLNVIIFIFKVAKLTLHKVIQLQTFLNLNATITKKKEKNMQRQNNLILYLI